MGKVLWNLFLVFITCGLWLVYLIVKYLVNNTKK